MRDGPSKTREESRDREHEIWGLYYGVLIKLPNETAAEHDARVKHARQWRDDERLKLAKLDAHLWA